MGDSRQIKQPGKLNDKSFEQRPRSQSPEKKIRDFNRLQWDLYDKSQESLPTAEASTSSIRRSVESQASYKDTQPEQYQTDQVTAQRHLTQLLQLENTYNQKREEINTLLQGQELDNNLLQNMQTTTIDGLRIKVEECIHKTDEIVQLTSKICEEKFTDLQDMQQNILTQQSEKRKIEKDILLLPEETKIKQKELKEYYDELDYIQNQKKLYISDSLQQVFLSQDEERINKQINKTKDDLKASDNLTVKFEEKHILNINLHLHKKEIENEIKSFYSKVESYNKIIETWISKKQIIEQCLANRNIYAITTPLDISMQDTEAFSSDTDSSMSIDSGTVIDELHAKMWEIIKGVK